MPSTLYQNNIGPPISAAWLNEVNLNVFGAVYPDVVPPGTLRAVLESPDGSALVVHGGTTVKNQLDFLTRKQYLLLGFLAPVPYAAGLVINNGKQVVTFNAVDYVPVAASLPFTTGAVFDAAKWQQLSAQVVGLISSDAAAASAAQAAASAASTIGAGDVQAQKATAYTTATAGSSYTITPDPAITAYAIGQSFFVTFNVGSLLLLKISGLADLQLVCRKQGGGYRSLIATDLFAGHCSRVTLISLTQAVVENMAPAITGVVSQSGGLPTGAVIERGSNANGSYVRFADGTQICTFLSAVVVPMTANQSLQITWTFPATFITAPVVPAWTGQPSISSDVFGFVYSNYSSLTSAGQFFRNGPTAQNLANLNCSAFGRWF